MVLMRLENFVVSIYRIEPGIPEKRKEAWNVVHCFMNLCGKVLIIVDLVHPDSEVVLDDVEHLLDWSVHWIIRGTKSVPMTRPNNQL